jgi:hypothetical protein
MTQKRRKKIRTTITRTKTVTVIAMTGSRSLTADTGELDFGVPTMV